MKKSKSKMGNEDEVLNENEVIHEEGVASAKLEADVEKELSEQELPPELIIEETKEKQEADKASDYLDRLQRLMAEFDNYRKRSQKEKIESYEYAVGNTVVELLPVIDNFERALKVESQDKAFYDGVTMIYKQFTTFLENINVIPIEAKDQIFDPKLHNAILHIEDESYGESVVVEELQKGYLYKEKVIRHSMVKVAN